MNEEETQEGNKIGGRKCTKVWNEGIKSCFSALRKRRRVAVLEKKQNMCCCWKKSKTHIQNRWASGVWKIKHMLEGTWEMAITDY